MTDLARRDVETAIELAATPSEANDVRRKIAAVQQLLGRRVQAFKAAHEGGMLYVEACAKAGSEWAKIRPGQGRTSPTLGKLFLAGFKNEGDATRCVRIGELDAQDRQLHYDECAQNGQVPTMNSMYGVWRLLYGEDGPEADWETWLKTALNACKRIAASDAPEDVRSVADGFVRRMG